MPAIRTLLVDDSSDFLDAAARFLSSDPGITIVGTTLHSQEALKQVSALNPDLVLMDLAMPGVNGLEVTSQIKSQSNPPRVIILTLYDNPEYRLASQAANADGFVAKSEFGVELLPMIHALFQPEKADR